MPHEASPGSLTCHRLGDQPLRISGLGALRTVGTELNRQGRHVAAAFLSTFLLVSSFGHAVLTCGKGDGLGLSQPRFGYFTTLVLYNASYNAPCLYCR